MDADGYLIPPGFADSMLGDAALSCTKVTGVIMASCDLLMDAGAIPDTRPPSRPPARRIRLRRAISAKRDHIAERAYEIISGNGFPEDIW